jgi:hypothetical protein
MGWALAYGLKKPKIKPLADSAEMKVGKVNQFQGSVQLSFFQLLHVFDQQGALYVVFVVLRKV